MNLKTQEPFFQDIRVRQAIGKAIDRTAIIREVLGGQAIPDDGPIPRSITWAYDAAAQQPPHDVAGARQLLYDARRGVGNGGRAQGGTPPSFVFAAPRGAPPPPPGG